MAEAVAAFFMAGVFLSSLAAVFKRASGECQLT